MIKKISELIVVFVLGIIFIILGSLLFDPSPNNSYLLANSIAIVYLSAIIFITRGNK